VRQALIYGFDYEKMEKTITFGVFPTSHNLISESTMFYDPACELYEYDPEKAVALLEEYGATEINEEGYRMKDGKVLELLYYVQPNALSEMIAEAFQYDMKQIGIKINAQVIEGRLHYSIGDADSPANLSDLGGGLPDPGLLFRSWYHSEGANYSHFANEYTDELIDAGLATNDLEKRQEIYSELQCYFMENAISVVGMTQQARPWGLAPDIGGWKADMYPIPHLYDVHYVK
jgi:peptide/nickel transport system substrate-binding protein